MVWRDILCDVVDLKVIFYVMLVIGRNSGRDMFWMRLGIGRRLVGLCFKGIFWMRLGI